MELDNSMPAFYKEQMLLDIHCGSQVKSSGDISAWFNQYSIIRQGELAKSEFCIALDRLGVEAQIVEQEICYEYFVKQVA